ncbi:MAG TPA: hypothetical protein VHW44_02800 [Pseudonocardiaceae bacterium]|jgi:hypothetical protein|nr:hypothetical protein [Pseudonocardiaceae bacterium]
MSRHSGDQPPRDDRAGDGADRADRAHPAHRAPESGRDSAWEALRPAKPANRAPRRKRVVLNDSRNPVTVLRTIGELEEQTTVGEMLVRNLMHAQFRIAVVLAAVASVPMVGLPVAFYLSPSFADVTVIGVRLPWLLIGVLPFPLLFGVGYLYNRLAERHERDFVNMVES